MNWRTPLLSLVALVVACSTLGESAAVTSKPTVLVMVGAGGESEFADQFKTWAGQWEKAAQAAGAKSTVIGLKPEQTNDLAEFKAALLAETNELRAEFWLVLIGHGTFNGREAKFNLHGPDLADAELATLLQPLRRPVAVIQCAAASAPFLNKLSASNRVIITATRSGSEQNFTRFGQYIAEAVTDPAADLDKDGQTSLLEAFLTAASRTAEFYKLDGRLATEHPLLDDNGDGLGTPADWFRGIRAAKKAKEGASLDGYRAHQFHLLRSEAERALPPEVRARRDELELSIARLRERKSELVEDDYYAQLEPLLLEMARLYQRTTAAAIPPATK